ncbi:MAG: DUF1667 domain-containing protein [Lachnospiraceae bacterium]|nr:DUF1667 domain-containing protein [Lachnospiraceae bacterium]
MDKTVTCIGCPLGCAVTVTFSQDGTISKITGNTCKRGEDYARKEVTNPARVVTSIVRVKGGDISMLSVKTASDIPKDKIFDCMEKLRSITVEAPVHIGDVILKDVCSTGIDVIATKEIVVK